MDSSNLSVIFAPNFFHCGDGSEKVNASTEKKLKLQAAVVQCLIDNSEELGNKFRILKQSSQSDFPLQVMCTDRKIHAVGSRQDEILNLFLVFVLNYGCTLCVGVAPDFILAKVPAMLGCEVKVFSPTDALEGGSTPSRVKRCRRSLGGKNLVQKSLFLELGGFFF